MKSLKNDQNELMKLLEKILKHSILKITFEEERSESIADYNFTILKTNVFYKDGRTEQIYLKMIKGGKIKESIFCYWNLLYEEYIKSNSMEDNLHKAIITQVTSDKNSSCILLTLDAKLNYCAEINLIELKKFYQENLDQERWLESLEIEDDDILFIGKKMY